MSVGELTFRRLYWDDAEARAAFQAFIREIHNLDFNLWERKGFWDERYTPFTLFDGPRVVSSVCLYSMDMVVEGRRRRLGQISGVGTLPEHRRRGLNRRLTDEALAWARETGHDAFFLFADDEAIPFYQRLGFQPVNDYAMVARIPPPAPRPGLRKLEVDDPADLALISALAQERSAVSDVLGVLNQKLLMFHALYSLRAHAYHVPALDVVVFFKVDGPRLKVHDVVGRRVPAFEELHPFLAAATPAPPPGEIWFHFMTDKIGVEGATPRALEGNNTHVLPGFPLAGERLVFPFTAHA